MKTQTKRAASIGASFVAVGAIVIGSFAFASAASQPELTPTPTAEVVTFVGSTENGLAAEQEAEAAAAEAARIEAERVAAEAAAAEAARIAAEQEAARIAAEQEAARIAAEQEAAEQGGSGGGSDSAPAPVAPAPAPAPEPVPLVQCPGGSSPTEVDGAGNHLACMWNTAPNGGSCFEGDNGMLPECQPFRP